MSHYRTEIYERTKRRLVAAGLVDEGRVTIERIEPISCRTRAEAEAELPAINLAIGDGSRERTTETAPLEGTTSLDVEVLVTGSSTEEVATTRDALCERAENTLLGNPLEWTGGLFKATRIADTVSQSQDADVLVGFAKLTFTLEIATVPTLCTEDMVEGIDVEVQTTEPDDDQAEMTFVAEPSVTEEE